MICSVVCRRLLLNLSLSKKKKEWLEIAFYFNTFLSFNRKKYKERELYLDINIYISYQFQDQQEQ